MSVQVALLRRHGFPIYDECLGKATLTVGQTAAKLLKITDKQVTVARMFHTAQASLDSNFTYLSVSSLKGQPT